MHTILCLEQKFPKWQVAVSPPLILARLVVLHRSMGRFSDKTTVYLKCYTVQVAEWFTSQGEKIQNAIHRLVGPPHRLGEVWYALRHRPQT